MHTLRMSARVTAPPHPTVKRSKASFTMSWRRFGMFPCGVLAQSVEGKSEHSMRANTNEDSRDFPRVYRAIEQTGCGRGTKGYCILRLTVVASYRPTEQCPWLRWAQNNTAAPPPNVPLSPESPSIQHISQGEAATLDTPM